MKGNDRTADARMASATNELASKLGVSVHVPFQRFHVGKRQRVGAEYVSVIPAVMMNTNRQLKAILMKLVAR